MPRPNKPRRVCQLPTYTHFFSQEQSAHTTNQGLLLSIDEYETIRLLDYMGMTQQEAAEQMGTGRTTIQALYTQARRKLSRFLVEGLERQRYRHMPVVVFLMNLITGWWPRPDQKQ